MLSRVAERVYWLVRYMERIENTARLVNVNANLLFDMPKSVKIGWGSLITITDSEALFPHDLETADEAQVMRFLIADEKNPISILSGLQMARENARITREVIPTEAWELINELYNYVKDNTQRGVARRGRHDFLNEIIANVQQFTGLLAGSMSHREGYDFIRLGRNLERADMTSRIVDAGCLLLPDEVNDDRLEREPYDNILWMSVLRSLSAYQMYRQYVRDRVNAKDVVTFLLTDASFPRSVAHCLTEIEACVSLLPNADSAQRSIATVQRRVSEAPVDDLLQRGLRDYLDQLQLDLGDIHNEIANGWFLPAVPSE